MPLCEICENLDLKNLTDKDNDIHDMPHRKSLVSLQQSSPTCALCRLFFSGLATEPLVRYETIDVENSPIIIRGRQYIDDEGNQGGIYMLTVRCDKVQARALFGLYVDESSTPPVHRDVIIGRAIEPAEKRFDLLQQWVQTCTEEHSLCQASVSRLPARVIDVGDADAQGPFLKVTKGISGSYIALSHCWGRYPLIRTTKDTFAQYQLKLPMEGLPKTFRDAVTITRMLKIRYLWIDSLCIIQDDVYDWEEQSAVMGRIYSQAYLTIAASAAKDSSGGCFLPRPRDTHVRVKCSLNSHETSYVFIREKPRGFSELSQSVLNTRAWVAQERLLSPRTIHYDTDQLLWECRSSRYTEDTVPVDAFSAQKLLWDGRLHQHYPKHRTGIAQGRFIWDWYSLIEDYTARNLSKPADKLPAISGLAEVMAQRTQDAYIAGLWESHLLIGLLWHRRDSYLTRPPGGYRAPSWSWAALDGAIVMPSEADFESVIPTRQVAQLVNVHITPLGLDPRGKLVAGYVIVAAPLRVVDLRAEVAEAYEGQATRQHLYDNGSSIGWAIFDEPIDSPGSEPVSASALGPIYCLQITSKALRVLDLCYSLLLVPTGIENEFQRVGLGCPTRLGWYAEVEMRTVTII